MDMHIEEFIVERALAHAKEVMGDDQFNDPEFEDAVDAIVDDFCDGVMWTISNPELFGLTQVRLN